MMTEQPGGPDPSEPPHRRASDGAHAAAEPTPAWVVSNDPTAAAEDLHERDRNRPARRWGRGGNGSRPVPPISPAGSAARAGMDGDGPERLDRNGDAHVPAEFGPADAAPDAADPPGPGASAQDVDDPTGVGQDEHGAAVAKWRRRTRRRTKPNRPFWVELPILLVIAFALTFLIQTFIAKVYYVPSGSMEQTLHGVTSGGDRILASKITYDFHDPRPGDVVVFKGPDTWAPEADIPGPSNWVGRFFQSVGSVVGIAPPNEKDFVKRTIAVGGQTVACCDKQGNVTVDGKPLSEPYIYQPIRFDANDSDYNCTVSSDGLHYGTVPPGFGEPSRCFAPFKVPDGQLWVMGDHRSDSADSSIFCRGLTAEGEAQYRANHVDHADCNRPIPVANVIGKAVFIVMPPSRWQTIGSPSIDAAAAARTPSGRTPSLLPLSAGVLITVGLRGGLALTPARRRRRSRNLPRE